jgi:hypothetical protein
MDGWKDEGNREMNDTTHSQSSLECQGATENFTIKSEYEKVLIE